MEYTNASNALTVLADRKPGALIAAGLAGLSFGGLIVWDLGRRAINKMKTLNASVDLNNKRLNVESELDNTTKKELETIE